MPARGGRSSRAGRARDFGDLCQKRVPEPLHFRACSGELGHGDDVESGRKPREILALLKKLLCRANQPLLLPGIDTSGCPSIPIARACPHFHDHQRVRIARNDIQLAQPAAEIALQDLQTLAPQERDRKVFGPLANNLPIGPTTGRHSARAALRPHSTVPRPAFPPLRATLAPAMRVAATAGPHHRESAPNSGHGARGGQRRLSTAQ